MNLAAADKIIAAQQRRTAFQQRPLIRALRRLLRLPSTPEAHYWVFKSVSGLFD